jgi:hypothetical protein
MTAAGQICFVAHNRNHVRIFADAARELRRRERKVVFAYVDQHQDSEATIAAAEKLGFPLMRASALSRHASAGDVVCVGNDWGPKFLKSELSRLKANGVLRVGVVEGARFAKPGHYRNVDLTLCWGPSGAEMMPGGKVVVGSPAIESSIRSAVETPAKPFILVNYKFARGAAELGPQWARDAARAADAQGADYVISAHPLNVGELAGLKLSHEPFVSLLNQATLLITRGSTVIYEALAGRVNVIYFPIADEWRAEFADPMGAFTIAATEAELAAQVATHCRAPAFDVGRASAFMHRHVDIDPAKPAPIRMADALEAALLERAEAPPPTNMLARLARKVMDLGALREF